MRFAFVNLQQVDARFARVKMGSNPLPAHPFYGTLFAGCLADGPLTNVFSLWRHAPSPSALYVKVGRTYPHVAGCFIMLRGKSSLGTLLQ